MLTNKGRRQAAPQSLHHLTGFLVRPRPPMPSPAAPSPAPMPQAPNASKAVGLGLIGKIFAGVAVLVIGTVAVLPFLGQKSATEVAVTKSEKQLKRLRANANRQELEDFVRENQGTQEAETAMMVLDSIEDRFWQSALASNDYQDVQQYLDQYPDGRYTADAAHRMDELNRGDVAAADTTDIIEVEAVEAVKEIISDTLKEEKKPVSPKKPVNKPKPPVTKPKTTPSKPKPEPVKPKVEPEKPAPVDPNKPVSFISAARKPVYKNCGSSNREKEEKCTVDKIHRHLKSRIEYPQQALNNSIEGTVVISFVVERNGSITDVKALNDIGGGCAKEAVRLVKTLPKFKPGLNGKGEPIRVQYTQSIRFTLK
ncbi:MAG: TonB family protein [Saprospiraceae bacterium]|nr:TonB family protein [Saprospiraceae bacterium]